MNNETKKSSDLGSALRFDRNQTLLLDFVPEEFQVRLPKHVTVDGEKLVRKNEFHMTILGNATGSLLEYLLLHRSTLAEEIAEKTDDYAWEELETEEYYLLRAPLSPKDQSAYDSFDNMIALGVKEGPNPLPGHRTSIIELRRMDDLHRYYKWFNEKIRTDFPQFQHVKGPIFPTPVPHVTLYTNGGAGIGIYSPEDLKKYMIRKVEKDELG